MALVVEMVVDRSMDGGEFLQGLDVSVIRVRACRNACRGECRSKSGDLFFSTKRCTILF